MKKKFVKVMLYGTLALASTAFVGCSDDNTTYDEEVKNLQEQIDAINKNGEVTTAELSKAINSAVAALKAELTTAIAGKVDNAVAAEISQRVVDLQNAMTAKADAAAIEATIAALKTELTTAISGKADEAKVAEISQKITELQATLAAKADAANVEAMKAELVAAIGEKADNAKVAELLVKTTELQAAIATKAEASAVEALVKDVASLTTEVNGVKTNVQAVKEALTAEINSVKVEIGKAASAETVADLKAKLATLEAQFAAAEAASSKSIAELQKDVEELTAELNNAATAESMRELASKLAEAENTLKAAKELAEGNATKIVAIQNQLAELVSIKSRLDALEAADAEVANINAGIKELKEADKAFAKQSYVDEALNAYMKQTEIVSLLDMRLAAYVTAEQADATLEEAVAGVKAYVDNTVKADLLAKISALDTKLTADIAAVSTKFDNYVSKQDADFQAAVKRLETLEAYKASAMEAVVALVNDDEKGNEALSAKIAAISEAMGGIDDLGGALANYVSAEQLASYKFVKEADLGAKIEEYLASYKEEIAGKFAAVEESMKAIGAEIDGIKAMIQSIVYVPMSFENGRELQFNTLKLVETNKDGKEVENVYAERKNATLKFQVSPASAAADFAKNYDVLFCGTQINKTRATAASKYLAVDPANIKADNDGIITLSNVEASTGFEEGKYYAVALKVVAKGAEENVDKNTDITSDYFVITRKVEKFKASDVSVKLNSEKYNIFYDEARKVELKPEVKYSVNGVDLTPYIVDGLIPEFPVSYALDSKDYMSVDGNGVITLNDKVTPNNVGYNTTITVSTKVASKIGGAEVVSSNNASKVFIMKKGDASSTSTVIAMAKQPWSYISETFAVTVDDIKNNIISNLTFNTTYDEFTNDFKYDTDAFNEALKNANFKTFAFSSGHTATATLKDGEKEASITVTFYQYNDKGEKTGKKIDVTYSAQTNIPVKKFAYSTYFWIDPVVSGDNVNGKLNYRPTFYNGGKVDRENPSSISVTMDLNNAFDLNCNYVDVISYVRGVNAGQANVNEFAYAKIVDANNKDALIADLSTTSKFDLGSVDFNKVAPVLKACIKYGKHYEQKYEAAISIDDMSGSWINGNTAVIIENREDKPLFAGGFTWKDARGEVMWKDGNVVIGDDTGDDANAFAAGVNALALYNLSKPEVSIVEDELGIIDVTKLTNNYVVSLTEIGKGLSLSGDYTVKINVKVTSPYGKVQGDVKQITVTIKK